MNKNNFSFYKPERFFRPVGCIIYIPIFVLILVIIFSFSSQSKNSTFNIEHSSFNIQNSPDSSDFQEDYYEKKIPLMYENFVYKKNIKTALLHLDGNELSQPIAPIGSSMKLSFDELDADLINYSYTFVHCDAEWKPSEISQSYFMDGFYDNYISEYAFSFNTMQQFVHYEVIFPNEKIKLKISGNYLLKVFENNDTSNLVLTKRFSYYEQWVSIDAKVSRPAVFDYRNYKHEIDFTINLSDEHPILNPFGDLKVVLMQNFRWDNAITNLKPQFINDKQLIYDYNEENIFAGENEYRNFDTRSFRFKTQEVSENKYKNSKNHTYLYTDEKRSFDRYMIIPDINGNYLVKNNDGGRDEIESDYTFVHFYLNFPNALLDGEMYIFGALSDWNFKEECKMKFIQNGKYYTDSIYLKQGYYNYAYSFLKTGEKSGDNTLIEGMHFETENNYTILVYLKEMSSNYQRLVGVRTINSNRF